MLVGTTPAHVEVEQIRRVARERGAYALVGVQGARLVVVLGRNDGPHAVDENESSFRFVDVAQRLEPFFGPGQLVLGHEAPSLVDAVPARALRYKVSLSLMRGMPRRVPCMPTIFCRKGRSPATLDARRPFRAFTFLCANTPPNF